MACDHSWRRCAGGLRQGELLTKMKREGLALREHRILAHKRRHRAIMKFLRKRGNNPAMGGVIGDTSDVPTRN